MKQLIYFLFAISFFTIANGQNVAINTDGAAANNSAMLDIKSTTKGMLVPRMTTAQRIAIASPATGLLVYDTDANSFWFYNGTAWTNITGPGGGSNGTNWKLSGNSGTISTSDFIGTTDNQSLRFKVNNEHYGLLDNNGSISWGIHSGLNNIGYSNIAIGSKALYNNINQSNLVAIGAYSLHQNQSGNRNTATGAEALFSNTTGTYNTANGDGVLYSNINGSYNTSVGYQSAIVNTSGSWNSNYGAVSFANNTTGNQNTSIGYQSMYANSTGSFNVALGNAALTGNVTGAYNTALGYHADVILSGLTNATAIGANATVNASNKVVIGNSSVTSIGGYANWSNFSDGRFKQNVKEDVPGLAFINKLRPVTYTLNVDAINDFNSKDLPTEKKQITLNADKKNIVYTGFMAQEVEQAAKSLNYNFSGIDKPKDDGKQTYALRYSDFVVPLVKAIQEQQKMIEDLRREIEALKKSK